METSHKDAMAQGRRDSQIVKHYLRLIRQAAAIQRRRTDEEIGARLAAIAVEMQGADELALLKLIQERIDLEDERDRRIDEAELERAEKAFITVARGYGERKGVKYQAFREIGVPPAVLRKAGVSTAHGDS